MKGFTMERKLSLLTKSAGLTRAIMILVPTLALQMSWWDMHGGEPHQVIQTRVNTRHHNDASVKSRAMNSQKVFRGAVCSTYHLYRESLTISPPPNQKQRCSLHTIKVFIVLATNGEALQSWWSCTKRTLQRPDQAALTVLLIYLEVAFLLSNIRYMAPWP